MKFFIVAIALATAGCAASVDGTELGGVAQWYGASPGEAVNAANVHCQKYGRVARVNQVQTLGGGYLAFSCEKS